MSAEPNRVVVKFDCDTAVSPNTAALTGKVGAHFQNVETADFRDARDSGLRPEEAVDQLVAAAPATVKELYRTAAPLPELKPGSYELNLTRVTFPPGMPSNPPHHRSGAALYYIVSGLGANTVDGKTAERGPGSLIYEPSGLVHQWGNPGSEPLTFLAFNINPEGVPAVVAETPLKP
jgi:quercetin dioxygenase-like cupin family protein